MEKTGGKFIERGNRSLKFIDMIAGIPLTRCMGMIRRNRTLPTEINRIALLKTAAIGDTVLISAMIGDIRDHYPRSHITLFTGSSNYEIAHLIVGLDRIIRLPIKNPYNAIKLVRKSAEYDVWIDFGQWPRLNALLSYFAKADFTIGFRTERQFRHYAYDFIIDHNATVHEIANFRNLLFPLGIEGQRKPALSVSDNDHGDKRIIIHMFPSGNKSFMKEWPEDSWVEVIVRLTKAGYNVILTGSREDRARAAIIADRVGDGRVDVVAGVYDLCKTSASIKGARLVISVNTGIMHIAAALDCNLVALHGPTSVKRWGPLRDSAISLRSSLPCAPCLNLGFEYGCNTNLCMREISVENVLKAASKFIDLS